MFHFVRTKLIKSTIGLLYKTKTLIILYFVVVVPPQASLGGAIL